MTIEDRIIEPENDLFSILDQVAAMMTPTSDRRNGEFTAAEYADRHGSGVDVARDRLRELVKVGKLLQRAGKHGGKACMWYSIAG